MKEISKFERDETFKRYQEMENPFIFLTVPLKITNIVNYSKRHKHFNCIFGYILRETANQVPAFRYRYIDGKYYFYDKVGISYTEFVDEKVVYFDCYEKSIKDFIKEYDKEQQKVKELGISTSKEQHDTIWVSCLPWMKFNSLVPPFNKKITIPQFIWDKYEQKDNDYYCNLMIMVHHGFADGYQVSEFINKLEENINNFK